jgi:mycoredoxin
VNGDGPAVTVYGTGWCGHTQVVRRHLERAGVPYRYVDLERHPDAVARLRWLAGGYASHPTITIGGDVLVEPTLDELESALALIG